MAASMTPPNAALPELPEDEDGMPVGYADWYNRRFFGQPVNTARDHDCETAWRAGALHALATLSPAELGGVEAKCPCCSAPCRIETRTVRANYDDEFDDEIQVFHYTPRADEAWQPIESAPKDGTPVLGWRHGWIRPCIFEWSDDTAWWTADSEGFGAGPPTHFKPLSPPSPGAAK